MVVGAISPEEAKATVEKWFGAWSASGPKPDVDLPPAPPNVSKARTLVQRDLSDMQQHGVTSAELQQAKALLLRQIPLAESSEGRIAAGLLERATLGLPLDEPILAGKRYYEMSADQVRTAFAKRIRPDDLVEVVQGPAPK